MDGKRFGLGLACTGVLSLFLVCSLVLPRAVADENKAAWWPDDVEQALKKAGKNRDELESVLAKTPEARRKGMAFLVANMPESDLKTLHADFLLENLDLAYKAREQTPWGSAHSRGDFPQQRPPLRQRR